MTEFATKATAIFDSLSERSITAHHRGLGNKHFFVINIYLFIFTHNTTQHPKYNKTKQQTHTQHLKVQSKGRKGGREGGREREGGRKGEGGREGGGRTTKTQKSLLHTIMYIKQKTLPSINGRRPGPTESHRCTFTSLFAGGYGSNMFFHMCGVNQFCIIVFFTAVKPANNILFCIELIQRPESSLRRHKLGLANQSIRSNDVKTRFTCVHRLMMIGHSQNI